MRYSGIRAVDDLHAQPASIVRANSTLRAIGRVSRFRPQQKKTHAQSGEFRVSGCSKRRPAREQQLAAERPEPAPPSKAHDLRRRPRHSPWQVLAFEKATWGDVGAPLARERVLIQVAPREDLPHPQGEGFEPSTPSSKRGELATCPTPSCCLLLLDILYLK